MDNLIVGLAGVLIGIVLGMRHERSEWSAAWKRTDPIALFTQLAPPESVFNNSGVPIMCEYYFEDKVGPRVPIPDKTFVRFSRPED